LADDPVKLSAVTSPVAVWSGSPFGPRELDVDREEVPSPSIVVFGERGDVVVSKERG
jgi:hypothetical protein